MAGLSHVYAGAVRSTEGGRGGVFRQAVGEERWEALTDGLPEGAEIHAITVHPEEPDVVFIAPPRGPIAAPTAAAAGNGSRCPTRAPMSGLSRSIRRTGARSLPASGRLGSIAATL